MSLSTLRPRLPMLAQHGGKRPRGALPCAPQHPRKGAKGRWMANGAWCEVENQVQAVNDILTQPWSLWRHERALTESKECNALVTKAKEVQAGLFDQQQVLIERKDATIQSLKDDNVALVQDNAEWQKRYEKVDVEKFRMQNHLDDIKQVAAAAEAARRELQQERDAARAELQAADQRLQGAEHEQQRLQAERTSSREALQSAERTQSELRRDHDDAVGKLQSAEQRLQAAELEAAEALSMARMQSQQALAAAAEAARRERHTARADQLASEQRLSNREESISNECKNLRAELKKREQELFEKDRMYNKATQQLNVKDTVIRGMEQDATARVKRHEEDMNAMLLAAGGVSGPDAVRQAVRLLQWKFLKFKIATAIGGVSFVALAVLLWQRRQQDDMDKEKVYSDCFDEQVRAKERAEERAEDLHSQIKSQEEQHAMQLGEKDTQVRELQSAMAEKEEMNSKLRDHLEEMTWQGRY